MRHRTGVSEIFASMIILVIVSSLGVILYNLALSTMSSQQNFLQSETDTQKSIAMERYEIIGATRSLTDSSKMNVTIYNYGQNDVKITDIYINGTKCTIDWTNNLLNSQISKNDATPTFAIIYIIPYYQLQNSPKLYNLVLVSERGVTNVARVHL